MTQPIVTDEEARELVARANHVIAKRKHWRLSPEDQADVRAELITEALVMKLAYQGGEDELLTTAMERCYGRWEYNQRKVYKHEALEAGFVNAEEHNTGYDATLGAVHDVYFAGTDDVHTSGA